MTKKDLIEVVAKKANLTNKASRDAVQTTLNTIRDSLKRGEKVVLTGFGTFSVRSRQQRVGRNPKQARQSHSLQEKHQVLLREKLLRRLLDKTGTKRQRCTGAK